MAKRSTRRRLDSTGKDHPGHPGWRPDGSSSPVIVFLALALGITWGAYAIRFAFEDTALEYPLTFVMKFGPSLAGVIATAWYGRVGGLRELFSRVLKWRVSPKWYLLVLLGPVVVFAVAIGGYSLLGGSGARTFRWEGAATLTALGSLFLVRLFAGGGFGEELGWRGFLLPVLQERDGPLRASIVIGLWHGLWHLPAYGIVGAGLLTIFTTSMSVVATWIYNETAGSVFLIAVLHAAFNAYIKWIETVAPGLDNQAGWVLLTFLLAAVMATWIAPRLQSLPPDHLPPP